MSVKPMRRCHSNRFGMRLLKICLAFTSLSNRWCSSYWLHVFNAYKHGKLLIHANYCKKIHRPVARLLQGGSLPLSFSLLHSPSAPSSPFSSPPFLSLPCRPLSCNPANGSGSAVNSCSGVQGEAPVANAFLRISSLKIVSGVTFFVIFMQSEWRRFGIWKTIKTG